MAIGNKTTASKFGNIAIGFHTTATGQGSTAIGTGVETADKSGVVALGIFNSVNTDALLSLGDGASSTNKHTAFEISKDSNNIYSLKLGATTITEAQLISLLALLNA